MTRRVPLPPKQSLVTTDPRADEAWWFVSTLQENVRLNAGLPALVQAAFRRLAGLPESVNAGRLEKLLGEAPV